MNTHIIFTAFLSWRTQILRKELNCTEMDEACQLI